MTAIDRQLELMEICEEIGDIAESNGPFLDGLVRRTGEQSIMEMTVAELLAVYRAHRDWFNRVYSP